MDLQAHEKRSDKNTLAKKVSSIFRYGGVSGLAKAVGRRIVKPRARCYRDCRELFRQRSGLELGGPSALFTMWGLFPLYPIVHGLDNCNFSGKTVWEEQLIGRTYRFSKSREPGSQFIGEATELPFLRSESYDFVLSSHILEHIANPLKALKEWIRVIREGGSLVIVVPHKDGTFDHKRPVTPIAHLVQDYENNMAEDDLTHLSEVLALHDLKRDPIGGGRDQFEARCRDNATNRCLHHHVFTTKTVVELVGLLGLQILALEALRPHHILLVARKVNPHELTDNSRFITGVGILLRRSPFRSDRLL